MKQQPQLQVQEMQTLLLIPYANNAKIHTREQVEQIEASIKEFGFNDPMAVWENAQGELEIIEGHGRVLAAQNLGLDTLPIIRLDHLSDEQRRAYTHIHNQLTMNTGFDFEKLEQDLDALDFDFSEFGFGEAFESLDDNASLSTEGAERDEDYNSFVEKLKPTKLTSDDCYTPKEVYQAIKNWACSEYGIDPNSCVRPFYPNGDYKRFNYPKQCTVLDNPPFSILAEILRFYEERGIRYFLFAPHLTLFSSNCSGNYLPVNVQVTYENGAKVNTGFVTSYGEWKIDTAPKLREIINNVQKTEDLSAQTTSYEYPAEVVSAAHLGRLATAGVRYCVSADECSFTRALDAQKETKQAIFGGGFLISRQAAARRKVAEEARQKNLKKPIALQLSQREQTIIDTLSNE